MKILEVNTVFRYGSTGRIVADLKQTLIDRGNTVSAAIGRNYEGNDQDVHIIGSRIQTILDVGVSRLFDNAGFGTTGPTRRLLELIDRIKPDILHLHNIHGYYINVRTLFEYLKKKTKVKVVWTLHDCWPITGHCTYFDYAHCNKWREKCYSCPQKKKYPSCYLLDRSTHNYLVKKSLFSGLGERLVIVTPSNWLAKIIKESFLGNYRIEVIHNGIDVDNFKPHQSKLREQYNIKEQKVLLAIASIWGERKGLNEYYKMSKLLSEDYKLVMIGVSDKQLAMLPNNIIGIKRTNSVEELAQWYSTADVLLNLSLEDNFPTINIEALACGTPILAYDTGGSAEAFDTQSGVCVAKGDLQAVVDTLFQGNIFLLSRDYCIQRSRLFDKRLCYRKYEELFADLISNSK